MLGEATSPLVAAAAAAQDVERSRQAGQGSKGPSKQLAAALCSLAEMKMSQAEDVAAVS